jgi:putative ABC transport system permease protein
VGFSRNALGQLKTIPGVESAALVGNLPLAGDYESFSFGPAGQPVDPNPPSLDYSIVSPEFFATAGIPLLQGRNFNEQQDTATAPRAVIINKDMADRLYSGESPIGKRIQIGRDSSVVREIIGVVGDVRRNGIGEAPGNQAYEVYSQAPDNGFSFILRTRLPPESLATAARNAIWAVDKDMPVGRVHSMNKVLAGNFTQPMFRTILLGMFSAIGLALAATGVYGVVHYSVTQRTREIGVRMALGARRSDVLGLVIAQGIRLVMAGLMVGLGAALLLTDVMSHFLFEVSATDPITFAGVALLLVAVALAACYIPARRASRVDPMVALRYE